MARKKRNRHAHELPPEVVAARMGLRASGAAGVHADQQARRVAAGGRTNRVGSRSTARRAAIQAASY